MKVFLSWSGERSKAVAILLSDWLSCVIQAVRPWISTRDIDRGAIWFSEIGNQLNDAVVGIVCLTQDNKDKPWILFEAGALAKGLTTSRVCTFLIDLEPKDIRDPLAQFNHTLPNRDGLFALVCTLNSALGSAALSSKTLDGVFDTYWPQFEQKFLLIFKETESPGPVKPREQDDVLSEILENTRSMNSRIRKLEAEVGAGKSSAQSNSGVRGFGFHPVSKEESTERYEEFFRVHPSREGFFRVVASKGVMLKDDSAPKPPDEGSGSD